MSIFIKIDAEFILSKVTQEQILERYLNIPVKLNTVQCSGLRKDKNPSCTFIEDIKGIIRYIDYGDASISGDCFGVVQCLNSCNYYNALNIIANDFGLKLSNISTTVKKVYKPSNIPTSFKKEEGKIQIKKIPFTSTHLKFWKEYGITKEILEYFNVYAISHYWFNGEVRIIIGIGFAYYFKSYKYKIYKPLAKNFRFITNTKYIQGYNQLPLKGNLLVITKSLKDVMVLYIYGIVAISLQAEGFHLDESIFKDLQSRFNNIISFYDFDYAGLKGSGNLKRIYGIQRISLSNGRLGTTDYKTKDISDYYKQYKYEKTKILTQKIIKYADNHRISKLSKGSRNS